ncbi:MAG: OmpA family protein [Flavobacteriaceae bacterium]|jgi:outer membrane protein OmpA-like peptidoglycan-associated protein/tetratricopeptide (TPR) repeat protein|nr:OmpA family protein [Flavobacteriaceae bacterium]
MKNRLLKICLFSTLLLGVGVNTYAQRGTEKKANKEFDKYAYVDAIKVYERIADKGYINTSVLTKLGDANYFNAKLAEANKWYDQLFNATYEDKDLSQLPAEYYYRYAQTLKAVGKTAEADQNLAKFAELEKNDSRAKLFESSKQNYLKEIEKMSNRFDIKNLPINSAYSDYGAAILGDKLIFTSARPNAETNKKTHEWTNENFTSLFETQINADGTFGEPTLFSKTVDSRAVNESTAVFTQDGNTMYFTRNNSSVKGKRKYNAENNALLKIYKATKDENGKWVNITELPFNSDSYNCAHPALTPDDKWLYFVSDQKGSLGQSDIFRVAIYPTGEYGDVENVGDKINTSGRETFPFISNDHMFYFASDGRPGLGGLDVYMAKLNVDGSFGQVVNMGTPINSAYDDFSFYIDGKSRKGFVSSNREGGQGNDDIYFFLEKVCKQALEGIVFDKDTKEVLANASLTFYNANYDVVRTIKTDAKGYYLVEDIDCGMKYRIKAEMPKYNIEESTVHLDYSPGVKKHDIPLEKTVQPVGVNDDLFKKLKLQPIYFDFDKSNIRRDASIELMKIVEVMKEYPTMKIDVRSHTDSRGNDDYNMKLSDRRAKSTVAWIISQGIDKNRISGKGYGESQLQNKCKNGVPCTVEEHQLNRRSEFIILEM